MPTPPQPSAEPPSRRDPALDGVRGVAVLLVFLFHYGGGLRAHNPLLRALGYLTQAGWMGVHVFFALSGFLITGLLADALFTGPPIPNLQARAGAPGLASETWVSGQPQQQGKRANVRLDALRNFYARRALRILPLYFAALLACAVAALLTGATLPQLEPLLVYALFLQNLPPLLNAALHTPPPLPVFHLWSLAVEEQFYLLWPFALIAARTPRRALLLSLYTFVASCLFRLVVFAPHLLPWPTANSFATFLPTRAGALVLGSALALYRRLPKEPASAVLPTDAERRLGTHGVSLAAIASLILIVITALQTHSLLLSNRPAFLFLLPAADVLSAALVAVALAPNLLRSVLNTRPLVFLGGISYGFYVFHILLEPVFDHLGSLTTHTNSGFAYQAARLVVALPLTTLAAWLSFTLLEQPFLRLKRRYPRNP